MPERSDDEQRCEACGRPRFSDRHLAQVTRERDEARARIDELKAELDLQQRSQARLVVKLANAKWEAKAYPLSARCQATTVDPTNADRPSCAWCVLPAGHQGMHRAELSQDAEPATLEWPELEAAQREPIGHAVVDSPAELRRARDPLNRDIRLHRMRKNLEPWTLRVESLAEAIQIRNGVRVDGWPIADLDIQRFTDGEWRDVPAAELREVTE